MTQRARAAVRSGVLTTLVLIVLSCKAVPSNESTYVRRDDPRVRRIELIFGLTPPYSIRSWSVMDDGGSTDGVLIGANRDSVVFSWDGAMRVDADSSETARPRLLYLGRSYRGGSPLAVASSEESALVDMLHISAVEVFGRQTLTGLDSLLAGSSPEGVGALIDILDEPKRRALRAHWLGQFIERQRKYPQHVAG